MLATSKLGAEHRSTGPPRVSSHTGLICSTGHRQRQYSCFGVFFRWPPLCLRLDCWACRVVRICVSSDFGSACDSVCLRRCLTRNSGLVRYSSADTAHRANPRILALES